MTSRLPGSTPFLLAFSTTGCLQPLGCLELLQCAAPGVSLDGDAATSRSTTKETSAEPVLAMEGGVHTEAGPVSTGETGAFSRAEAGAASSDVEDAPNLREAGVSTSAETQAIASVTLADASPDSAAQRNCSIGAYWSNADGGACVPWTTCESGTYVGTPGSTEADRQCLDCPSDTYSTSTNSTSCSPCNHCGWLGLESACSTKRDALCRNTDVTRQFGTTESEFVRGLTIDHTGGVWIVGSTAGTLGTDTAGDLDAFAMYYPQGVNTPTVYQFGTDQSDTATAVACDKDGNIWVVGSTYGALSGTNLGQSDAFVLILPADRTKTPITYQFGTPGLDVANAVVFDRDGNAWIGGDTTGKLGTVQAGGGDGFLRIYPSDDSSPVTHQFGTSSYDSVFGVAIDEHNQVWVAGSTDGTFQGETNAGGKDAFARRCAGDGSDVQVFQFGTAGSDSAKAIAHNSSGAIWVVGQTAGNLATANAGLDDVFMREYVGAQIVSHQFGTLDGDAAVAVAAGLDGEVWIAGTTYGTLAGESAGSEDAFVHRFRRAGALSTTQQFGSNAQDRATALASDTHGNVWVGGYTSGALSGSNRGDWDGFVRQIAH